MASQPAKIKQYNILNIVFISIGLTAIASFFDPILSNLKVDSDPSRSTGFMAFIIMSIFPLFFLSLINIILKRSIKSVVGTFLVIISLVLIVLSYKYLPVNIQANRLIIISFLIPALIIAITRALNIGGGYKEIIIGALIGYLLGVQLIPIFYTIFFIQSEHIYRY